MFDGFRTRIVAGAGADINVRTKGSGKPLLLLHGYPETGAMWAGIAEALAERFSVVVADLRGYGGSSVPANDADNIAYSKRRMGEDMLNVMSELGFSRFSIAGHDRGARVAYRMALDHPEAIERLAVLDIVPVSEVWERMDAASALTTYHWPFLAQPHPLPETLIAADPVHYLDHTIASWTKRKSLEGFAPEALAEYRESFSRPAYVEAACNDYRAGATIDWRLDREDRESDKSITAPTLVLWGGAGNASKGGDAMAIWENWCSGTVEGHAIDAGHFVVEEAPDDTVAALLSFFSN